MTPSGALHQATNYLNLSETHLRIVRHEAKDYNDEVEADLYVIHSFVPLSVLLFSTSKLT